MTHPPITAELELLREMVRLSEDRRKEMLQALERVNQYNLALIAFSAGFLSVLVTLPLDIIIVRAAGALLLVSIVFSLLAVRPKTLHNVTMTIDEDVQMIKRGHTLDLREYLLLTAELTDTAATHLSKHGATKKALTISSATSLGISLFLTYILYAYA